MLSKRGVVEKFVEFFGPGLANLSASDRNTIGNMAPEYGATCGIFPIDEETLNYLRLTGRSDEQVAIVKARSEEHTSELQSLMRISYAVFCLKKKKHTSKRQ